MPPILIVMSHPFSNSYPERMDITLQLSSSSKSTTMNTSSDDSQSQDPFRFVSFRCAFKGRKIVRGKGNEKRKRGEEGKRREGEGMMQIRPLLI